MLKALGNMVVQLLSRSGTKSRCHEIQFLSPSSSSRTPRVTAYCLKIRKLILFIVFISVLSAFISVNPRPIDLSHFQFSPVNITRPSFISTVMMVFSPFRWDRAI